MRSSLKNSKEFVNGFNKGFQKKIDDLESMHVTISDLPMISYEDESQRNIWGMISSNIIANNPTNLKNTFSKLKD